VIIVIIFRIRMIDDQEQPFEALKTHQVTPHENITPRALSEVKPSQRSFGSSRMRKQIKPLVFSRISPEMPDNLASLYREFLNQSNKDSSYKYVNTDTRKSI
jgi:phosphomannomutase